MDYFAKVAQESPNRPNYSGFDLSFSRKQTQSIGRITPSGQPLDIVPGDNFDINCSVVARSEAMLTPLLHHVDVRMEYFFVPYRILAKEFENFIKDPRTSLIMPNVNIDAFIIWIQQNALGINNVPLSGFGSLADYLGLPMSRIDTMAWKGLTCSDVVSLFPFLAYQLIWHNWYQYKKLDEYQTTEDLINDVFKELTSVQVTSATQLDNMLINLFSLRNRIWSRDYFTECTREPQMGDPVAFPFDGTAPVSNGVADFGDPSAVVNTLLRDIRCAADVQQWLEKQNAAGFDYRETILQHFGVWNNDGRLQKPEFLGSRTFNFIHSDVTSTSDTDNANLGEMAGKAFIGSGKEFITKNYKCTEHGMIMPLATIVPQSGYYQGLSRLWTKQTPLDYYWPEFQDLGDQPVYEKELYLCADEDAVSNDDIFGYNKRYSEYKQIPDQSAGYMNAYKWTWHLNRYFMAPPALGEQFEQIIAERDGLNRNFSVQTDNSRVNVHNYQMEYYHEIHAARPMNYTDRPHVVKI